MEVHVLRSVLAPASTSLILSVACEPASWRRRLRSMRLPIQPCQEQAMQQPNRRAFIFGLGYVGHAFARYLQIRGWDVSGTCSTYSKKEILEQEGINAFLFTSKNEEKELEQGGLEALYNSTHMLCTIPPIAYLGTDPVLSLHRRQLVQAVSNMNLVWIGYLSSTGVYGSWEGAWVDEESEPKPVDNRAVARLEAEQAWLLLGRDSGACVQIFRLGGIYGTGRSAVDTLLRHNNLSSRQQAREGRLYTSRIHVADICQVVFASMKSPLAGRVYNVVDNDPASRSEVFSFAWSLIKEKWPQKLSRDVDIATPSAVAVGVDYLGNREKLPEKRVLNKRVIDELKVELLYPTYRSGLKSIIEGMSC